MSEGSNRAAIVTGGSRGIGAAVARRLARDGIAVAISYAHDAAAADAIAHEIEQAGGRAVTAKADIGERTAMTGLFDIAEKAFGGVDILVNNAAVMRLSPIAEMEDDVFEEQVARNLGGVFRGMREAARRLRNNGRIISFSSTVVGLYQPTYGAYAATKAAVEALTHILAKEVAPRGITANVVAPGPVETELFLNGKSDAQVRAIASANPFGRLGQPSDIAGVVAFLAGPDSGWVNGQTIRVNGGVI